MSKATKIMTDTRVTGALYLGLGVSGAFAFIFARSKIYIDGNALATNTNLLEKEMLARVGIVAEVVAVAFQALAAIWFYKLFHGVNKLAAIMIAAFGLVNAAMILVASGLWLGAVHVALAGEPAVHAYNLLAVHESLWLVSGLFFGLWLIPMGYVAVKATMPKYLAWFLMGGGVGYILSTFVYILFPHQKSLADTLTIPATIGEFWMIGYLLAKPRLNITKR